MATIAQNLQALSDARDDIATAITDKGVILPEGAGFRQFPDAISSISGASAITENFPVYVSSPMAEMFESSRTPNFIRQRSHIYNAVMTPNWFSLAGVFLVNDGPTTKVVNYSDVLLNVLIPDIYNVFTQETIDTFMEYAPEYKNGSTDSKTSYYDDNYYGRYPLYFGNCGIFMTRTGLSSSANVVLNRNVDVSLVTTPTKGLLFKFYYMNKQQSTQTATIYKNNLAIGIRITFLINQSIYEAPTDVHLISELEE